METKTLHLTTKTIGPKLYLCHTQKTTLSKMMEAAEVVHELYEVVEKSHLEVVGVMEFIYMDSTGKMDDIFTLKIGIPVKAGTINNPKFALEELGEFKCITYTYKGDVSKIGSVYPELITAMLKQGYRLTNQIREVYEQYITLHEPNNSTEIQVGIL